jgi:hypothetical protein
MTGTLRRNKRGQATLSEKGQIPSSHSCTRNGDMGSKVQKRGAEEARDFKSETRTSADKIPPPLQGER